jgi:ADP-dependent NAD(P)H-hydrate dehydratase / NAD(P)H-hydrate epimerase
MSEPDRNLVQELDDQAVAALLPVREPRAHKGDNGRVLVVAGSLDFAGAGLLASHAAGRAGAGLVTLAVPRSLQPVVAGRFVEVITLGLPERAPFEVDADACATLLDGIPHDALVLGPGLRRSDANDAMVRALLAQSGAPAVVDAEALNALSRSPGWHEGVRRSCVLTPHPGEFRRLRPDEPGDLAADDDARERAVREAAAAWNQVVLLKGARTVVAGPGGEAARVPFENPALGTGGTGDVLSGVIGALLGQRLDPYGAARVGVYLHGTAGEVIRERLGDSGLLASDLPGEIAHARHRLAGMRERRVGGGRRVGFAPRGDIA